jgi:hypothetical protein
MRAILVTAFPERFVRESILPDLRKRVDVLLVATPKQAALIQLSAYEPDVVLHMAELGGHSEAINFRENCRRADIPIRLLSRKKSSWNFLPPPSEPKTEPAEPKETPMNGTKPQIANGKPTLTTSLGELPGAKEALRAAADPPKAAPAKAPDELATALSEFSSALRFHGEAMLVLAVAIEKHGTTPAVGEPKPDPVAVKLTTKIIEIVGKIPGMSATEIGVLVAGGAGGEAIEAPVNVVAATLTHLTKSGKLDRKGTGGKNDPYRYFPLQGTPT